MTSLADIPFYGVYKEVSERNRQAGLEEQSQQLKQVGLLAELQAKMVAQQEKQRAAQKAATYDAEIAAAAGDPVKLRDIAMRRGLPADILRATQPDKPLADTRPEVLKLTEVLETLTPNHPARPFIISRLEALGAKPEKPQNQSNLSRLIAERDQLPQGDTRRVAYDNAIRKESETAKQIVPQIINQPADAIINTSSGIFARDRSGKLTPQMNPATNEPLRPGGSFSPNIERNISQDFERNPVVKGYMELQPDVEVVNNYMKRRPTVTSAQRATYDKNLVNTYMRVTHPKGDQISNFERRDLGALPALPDRITRAIEGFFEGSYVPDDVASEMANIINDKFTARGRQVSDIENKVVEDVRRQGGNPDVIRKVTRGQAAAVPQPAQRVVGQVYDTPKGKMKWTGTGWLPN